MPPPYRERQRAGYFGAATPGIRLADARGTEMHGPDGSRTSRATGHWPLDDGGQAVARRAVRSRMVPLIAILNVGNCRVPGTGSGGERERHQASRVSRRRRRGFACVAFPSARDSRLTSSCSPMVLTRPQQTRQRLPSFSMILPGPGFMIQTKTSIAESDVRHTVRHLTVPGRGDIVLARFPFTDGSGTKLRPGARVGSSSRSA